METGFQFRLNPPRQELGQCSALLHGVARQHHVEGFRTTLAIKSVARGAAYYRTGQGHFLVEPDRFLVLNHDQRYSLDFQSDSVTETVCPFFEAGLAEHVAHCRATPAERQLDDIADFSRPVKLVERLYPKTGTIGQLLAGLHGMLRRRPFSHLWLEEQFYALAEALVELDAGVKQEALHFPGLRAATRLELYRRLHRARDFMSSCYWQPLTVTLVARVAHLSTYHFQRSFRSAFSQTPMQFLQRRRLEVAKRLLLTTDKPIAAIAGAVGFESPGSFSWLFHRRFLVPPRVFRANGGRPANSQD